MKTIIVDATGRSEQDSKTKYLANRIIEKLNISDYEVVDLYKQNVPFVTKEIIESWKSDSGSEDALSLLRQFEGCDQVIFIYPTWNWSVPAALRAYMDLIIISGRTFGYNNRGKSEGYLNNKKAILISTTGGKTHSRIIASILKAQDGNNYMQQVLGTIGIKNITKYSIDNTAYDFNDQNGNYSHDLYKQKVDCIVKRIT
ncbi:NAD(P)H-dependent oxidoreductase [Mollicutes bacterium LVI A0078]|nr:NAD(P)H-dependent oxidoreductase [Mollicutes bacterium LVI A0075]WOO90093.1 NAD(P)H-dependent oxidoreductase [Mollicutes bacterium LVI A0078]